jgi:putative Mg2+ transporter-C (MgtC) family protein
MENWSKLLEVLPTFILRGGFAVVCGGIIGMERERAGKPAGFRTNILICLGAALYMMMSDIVAVKFLGRAPADPGRIAAQVVSGIGFLGAGTILRERGSVTGLTSAATIWVVAAIGLFIGVGYTISALVFSGLVVLTLTGLKALEPRILGHCEYRTLEIHYRRTGAVIGRLDEIVLAYEVDPTQYSIEQTEDEVVLKVRYCIRHPEHSSILSELWSVGEVLKVTHLDQDKDPWLPSS